MVVQRFGLIDHALAAWATPSPPPKPRLWLEPWPGWRDLAVVMNAEALLTLTDLCELAPDDATTDAVATARTSTQVVVEAAFEEYGGPALDPRH